MFRPPIPPVSGVEPGGARIARQWPTDDRPRSLPHHPRVPLGCVVVRRIADDCGRSWRVRPLALTGGPALLFQCEVPGLRSEVRPLRSPLDALTDEALLTLLSPSDD